MHPKFGLHIDSEFVIRYEDVIDNNRLRSAIFVQLYGVNSFALVRGVQEDPLDDLGVFRQDLESTDELVVLAMNLGDIWGLGFLGVQDEEPIIVGKPRELLSPHKFVVIVLLLNLIFLAEAFQRCWEIFVGE